MWVCYLIALVPVLLGAVLWLRTRRITFAEWMVGSLFGLLVAVGFHVYAIAILTLDVKIVSGPVSHVTFYPAYSGGETEPSWGDHWTATLDLGDDREDLEIPDEEAARIREQFGASELVPSPPEIAPPDDEAYRVHIARNLTGALIPGWTLRLIRRPSAGQDLFRFSEVPGGLPLFDYPYAMDGAMIDALIDRVGRDVAGASVTATEYQYFDWRRSGRLLGHAATDLGIRAWDALNAELGPSTGVNLIAIGFDGDSSLAHWQEARWQGGKPNDLVLCYGPTDAEGKPSWTYCFGWSDSETVKRNLESLWLARGVNDDVLPAVGEEVRARYRPRAWPVSSYFWIRPPRNAIMIMFLVALVLQGGYWLRAFLNRERRAASDAEEVRDELEENRKRSEKRYRKFLQERIEKELAHLGKRPDVETLQAEMLGGSKAGLATEALQRRPEDEIRGAMVLGLTSHDRGARKSAEEWLNEHVRQPSMCREARTVVPVLIDRLEAKTDAVRAEARRVLELVDPTWRRRQEAREGIPRLLDRLRTEHPEERYLEALGARGPLVVDELLEMAGEVTTRPEAATQQHGLLAAKPTEIGSAQRPTSSREDKILRASRTKVTGVHALRALAYTGDPRAVPLLLDKLHDEKEIFRHAAVDGLARFGAGLREVPEADRIFTEVLPLLRSVEHTTRLRAMTVLGWLGREEAVAELVPFLSNQITATFTPAATALGRIGSQGAIDALVEKLDEAGEMERIVLVRVLARTGKESIVPPLRELLRSSWKGGSMLAEEILDALLPFGGPELERLLEEAAGDFMCSVQDFAARRLHQLREGPHAFPWSRT